MMSQVLVAASLWLLPLLAAPEPHSDDPIRRIQPCRGCSLIGSSEHDYRNGVRIRYQAGFEKAATVFFVAVVGRSGRCDLVANTCLDTAPCVASQIAAIHNSSGRSLWFQAGRDFVRTPLAPKPDKEGFVEILPGKTAVYRTRGQQLYCNDIDVYHRLDVRDAKNGKLVVSLEWSAKCTRCRSAALEVDALGIKR